MCTAANVDAARALSQRPAQRHKFTLNSPLFEGGKTLPAGRVGRLQRGLDNSSNEKVE